MKADVRKLKLNMLSALLLQIITVICGFILPRLILKSYGSDVNGLISSITQFLTLISFLDCGMGIVVQSALYKPLVDNNTGQVNLIISSATNFYRRLAYILVGYVVCLTIILPYIIDGSFSKRYIATLILILSVGTFVQYDIGAINGVILAANQKSYISNVLQCIAVILNTALSSVLIMNNFSIHFVRFVTMLTYLIRPLLVHLYICKKYNIDRRMKYKEEPIPQKWNGIAQHVATIVLDNTDIVVLSIFDAVSTVSIYSVYNLVVTGIRQVIMTVGNGFHSYWGSLFAEKEYDKLSKTFGFMEWLFHNIVVVLYGITAILIVPFVLVYTKGVNDANYYQPLFAILLVIAQALRCVRIPYNTLIQAIGHYKQTQSSYLVAALINIVISIAAVEKYGLVGVAIGTICAMLYQLVWMICYDSRMILHRSLKVVLKQVVVDFVLVVIGTWICSLYTNYNISNYYEWVIIAMIIAIVWCVFAGVINFQVYKEYSRMLIGKFVKRREL